jgi:hypothetical protein
LGGGRRSDSSAGRSQEVKPCLVFVGDGISGRWWWRRRMTRSLAAVGHAGEIKYYQVLRYFRYSRLQRAMGVA